MAELREWRLKPGDPLALQIASDARLGALDYADDQVWEWSLGAPNAPALAISTAYGGRAKYVSIAPLWFINGAAVDSYERYAEPPVLTRFAPGYARADALIAPGAALIAEVRAFESHAIGGRFTIENTRDTAIQVRFDLLAFVIRQDDAPAKIAPLARPAVDAADDSAALMQGLTLGAIGSVFPVIQIAGGQPQPAPESASRLMSQVTIAPGESAHFDWVCAARGSFPASAGVASRWLHQIRDDWAGEIARIEQAAARLPHIESGDAGWDAAIAFGVMQALQAFMQPPDDAGLPHASFVATRQPSRGYSPRGDGTDHLRSWSGQDAAIAYPLALMIAGSDATLAQGVVLNALAVQKPDGWIDAKPGLAGQTIDALTPPIWARLTWSLYQTTGDRAFLTAALPGLRRLYERWSMPDLDADQDGLPEWTTAAQPGFAYFPIYNPFIGRDAIDPRLIEAPDLAAMRLSEALSLIEIAYTLGDEAARAQAEADAEKARAALASLWRADHARFAYRDRDTHEGGERRALLEHWRGEDERYLTLSLQPASRVIVRISGGERRIPSFTVRLDGVDANGETVSETAAAADFVWGYGRGMWTTRTIFAALDRITLNGLARVYDINISTPDIDALDANALLPLWAVTLDEAARAGTIALALEPRFWRANGIPMIPADDPEAKTDALYSVRPYFVTWIGEGLIEAGRIAEASELARRLLDAQTAALKTDGHFSEYYHPDEARAGGERGHVGGLPPLHLLLRVWGVRIVDGARVWAGGRFAWPHPIRVGQHGVTVERSADGTRITFASGRAIMLPPDTAWGEHVDNPGTDNVVEDIHQENSEG